MTRPANDNLSRPVPQTRPPSELRIRYHPSREDLSFADVDAVGGNDNRRRSTRALLIGIAAAVALALLCTALLITR